ncbi:MAG: YebC/PmpR family DNA-binding transcriptional regulator [Bacteroidales bacterium]|nr:YebC/PmpR family DNA-binding transcriptional regulator [Bacteroidales bacterium]
MSGHNKWSTIKRKKEAQDAKKSKIFTKIVKEIQVAVREGGADPDLNPRLRLALQNAKGANMPKENIQRAINKANEEGANLQEVTFEGYTPGGVAVIIDCLTDNNNRTVSNIRAIFNKRGGSLGTKGSLSFLFERKGTFTIPISKIKNREEFELEIIDAGVEDIDEQDDVLILTCPREYFGKVNKKLEEMKIEPENAEIRAIPNEYKTVDLETAQKVLKMIEEFEELDDVQNVWHNLNITDEIAKAIS